MSAAPPQPDLATTAWQLMRSFVDSHSRKARVRDQLRLGAGSGRVRVLLLLRRQPMTFGELADMHGVGLPYMSKVVDQLEALGFAERHRDPGDRRKKIVTLTSAGHQAAATAERILSEAPPELRALSGTQLAQLTSILSRLLLADPGHMWSANYRCDRGVYPQAQ